MMPEKMKAVFLDKPGGQLIVRETEVPRPGKGEVLVKILAAPVNPSDLARIRNAGKSSDAESFIPGIEGSGRVVEAGSGLIPKLWLGKRVSCLSHYSTSGTWAEYMVTQAGLCFPLNSKVSDEQGSMSVVNPLTAIGFIDLAWRNKHKVIINNAAASALGRMLELLAKRHRIKLINIVRSRKNADLLKASGSEYVLDSSDPSFIGDLGSLTTSLNAKLLFDSVPSPDLFHIADVLPKGSTIVIYGNLTQTDFIKINPGSLIDRDIHIAGFHLITSTKKKGMAGNILDLIKVGRLMRNDMQIHVSGRFPLESAQLAVDTYINNMSAGKVLIIP